MHADKAPVIRTACGLVPLSRPRRRLSSMGIAFFLVPFAFVPVEAEVVLRPSGAMTDIPFVVTQARPDLSILTDVQARRFKGEIIVSGTIQVDTRRRANATRNTPNMLRIELLNGEGTVLTARTLLLGPHGLHIRGAQMPKCNMHLDVEQWERERLHISIDEDNAH